MQGRPSLAILFDGGCRPDMARLAEALCAAADPLVAAAALSPTPGDSTATAFAGPVPANGRVSLRVAGFTFEVAGLAPAEPDPAPAAPHCYGVTREQLAGAEAILLRPAHNCAPASNIQLARVMMEIGLAIAALDRAIAACWGPARTAMGMAWFVTAMERWLSGGAFPALGLTALAPTAEGAMRSEGLALFTGHEVVADARIGPPAEQARLLSRMIHHLIHHGPVAIAGRLDVEGIGGVRVERSANGDDMVFFRS